MRVLGIETSSPVTSVALWRDGAPVAGETSPGRRDHVEFLVPAIRRLVGDDGLGILDAIAVGIGPGLFTSMRVGIATAKSLAVTLEVPVVGVCSLDALARGVRGEPDWVCACVDARRGEVFAALYEGGSRVEGPAAQDPGALAATLRARSRQGTIVGDGPAAHPAAFDGFALQDGVPAADGVIALALPRLASGEVDDALRLEPMYVRRSDAEIKWEQHGVVIERPSRIKIAKRKGGS